MSASAAVRNNAVVSGVADGRPMVFLHGFGCDQSMWRHVSRAFEEDHRVVLLDHGGTTRRVLGMEALVRWEHPQRGLVSPAEFIAVLMQSTDAAAAVLAGLVGLGVKLLLDDFGTGASSLSRLKRFPGRHAQDRRRLHPRNRQG